MSGNGAHPRVLGLRAGDFVEVRSEREILSTLDENGKVDGLPFMPEMLQYCGRRTQVFRRADKTCDTVSSYTSRRLTNTVHLENLRCSGQHHGGCEAGCLLFWKEAWLKPQGAGNGVAEARGDLTPADLEALTTRPDPASDDRVFVCQATELPTATSPLPWWDPRQYIRELWSGNVRLGTFIRALAIAWFNAVQRWRDGRQYPDVAGALDSTPSLRLDLRPGERVRVRSREEIVATLNRNRRNRGLAFDVEMVPYCGGEYRVLRRVTKIVEERTGKMVHLPGDCIILDGVVCGGCLSRNRLFCPRSIYPYWREIWLERVP
jgi:hypothetical protein